jgi:hypothetical protein
LKHKISAICPRCRKVHKTKPHLETGHFVEWTGNGTPRLVCKECKHMSRQGRNRAEDIEVRREKGLLKAGKYEEDFGTISFLKNWNYNE